MERSTKRSTRDDVAVIGLGKLGLCIALLLAKQYRVIGLDCNEELVKSINSNYLHYNEPGVDDMIELKRCGQLRLYATTDIEYAVRNTDVVFVIVPTPSMGDNTFSLEYVKDVIRDMGPFLRKSQLIVLSSTVLVGDIDKVIKPLIEKVSGLKVGKDIGLCYNPEFVALGNVIKGFSHPDMLLVGESDTESGNRLVRLWQGIIDPTIPVHRMSFANAELTKIALNAYITSKIAFANMLAEICESFEGGDIDKVTAALGSDSRISNKYLKGGLSYGGACFPRDSKAFPMTAERHGVWCPIIKAVDRYNEHTTDRIIEMVLHTGAEKVAVLGTSFKPGTDVVDESASLKIALGLAARGVDVKVHDPKGLENAKKVMGISVKYCDSVKECVRGAEVAVVAVPWDEYKGLKAGDFKGMKKKVVIDCWRLLSREDCNGIKLVQIGIGK